MTAASIHLGNWPWSQTSPTKSPFQIKGAIVRSDLVAGMLVGRTYETIGVVSEIVTDRSEYVDYLVVDLDRLGSARRVRLAPHQFRIDRHQGCVYAAGLTRAQAEMLPEYRN